VLPVFEELNGLLFYPVQYEGEEISKNVFYTGAAPNQQAIPAVEYLMSKDGGGAKRWVLLGTDYVYPRTTNKILRAFLSQRASQEADIMEDYTPFGHSDYQTIIAKIKKFSSEGKKTGGRLDDQRRLERAVLQGARQPGPEGDDVPVVAFSVGEEELRGVDTKPLVGTSRRGITSCRSRTRERRVEEEVGRLHQVEEAAVRRQAAHQRPDGSRLHRRLHVEAGRSRRPRASRWQGDRGDGRADVQGPSGITVEDGREEPPPAQGGVHRRR
jgi:urea transport system substrate-binding protein